MFHSSLQLLRKTFRTTKNTLRDMHRNESLSSSKVSATVGGQNQQILLELPAIQLHDSPDRQISLFYMWADGWHDVM
jgi:hypothetical protein